MKRTNIYLDDEQLRALRAVSESRGEPVAALVRQALDEWLAANGVRAIPADEWRTRFDALLRRRATTAAARKPSPARVEQDVAVAVTETRSARRR